MKCGGEWKVMRIFLPHLDSVQLFFGSIPFMSESNHRGSALSDCDLLAYAILLSETGRALPGDGSPLAVRVGLLTAAG